MIRYAWQDARPDARYVGEHKVQEVIIARGLRHYLTQSDVVARVLQGSPLGAVVVGILQLLSVVCVQIPKNDAAK